MARKGAFKSEKRKKEVIRQKKQEEKRLKRLHKDSSPAENTDLNPEMNPETAVEAGTESEPAAEGGQAQTEP